MQAEFPNINLFLPREQGTSVGKKYDGKCKKEVATVSVSCLMKG